MKLETPKLETGSETQNPKLETASPDPQCFCAHLLSAHDQNGHCTADLGDNFPCGCLSFTAWKRPMEDRPLTGILADCDSAAGAALKESRSVQPETRNHETRNLSLVKGF